MIRSVALGFLLASTAAPTLATEIKAGDLTIDQAWTRATPKGAPVGVGYLTIHNNGAEAEQLTGGTSEFGAVQVHEMSVAGGVMKMREVEGGLSIPAHGVATLAPSGYHLMFANLKAPFVKGGTVKATLNFSHTGPVDVTFDVRDVGAAAPKAGAMGGMKM